MCAAVPGTGLVLVVGGYSLWQNEMNDTHVLDLDAWMHGEQQLSSPSRFGQTIAQTLAALEEVVAGVITPQNFILYLAAAVWLASYVFGDK